MFSSVTCLSHDLWFCDSFSVEADSKTVPPFKSYVLSVKTTVHCIYHGQLTCSAQWSSLMDTEI